MPSLLYPAKMGVMEHFKASYDVFFSRTTSFLDEVNLQSRGRAASSQTSVLDVPFWEVCNKTAPLRCDTLTPPSAAKLYATSCMQVGRFVQYAVYTDQ